MIATPLAISILLSPSPAVALDPIFAYSPREATVFAISTGYFFYDLAVSIYFVRVHGFAFVLHAAACCFIFGAVWRPILMGVGATFLVVRFPFFYVVLRISSSLRLSLLSTTVMLH